MRNLMGIEKELFRVPRTRAKEIPHAYPCTTPDNPTDPYTAQSNVVDPGNCPPPTGGPGWVPIEDQPGEYNPYQADEVIIDPSIKNYYPCVSRIIDSLTNYSNMNALAQVALHTVFGVNEKMHLTFKTNSGWTQSDDDAGTKPDSSFVSESGFYATIQLNPWVLKNSTEEYIASTIIHEAIHAYIDFKYYQYITNQIDSIEFKTLFPIYWPPNISGGIYIPPGNLSQHKIMASNLVATMTNSLISTYPNASIPPELRDSIYRGLTWGGLQHTTAFLSRSDTLAIKAINIIARDTSVHAPFILTGYPTPQYTYDAHNLNMKIGCQ